MLTASLALTAVATGSVMILARPLLTRLGAVDVPSNRSSHQSPTLRGGGIGPLAGVIAGGVYTVLILPQERTTAVVVLVASVVTGLVGLIEDIRGLRILVRAGTQLIIGAALVAFLGHPTPGWMVAGALCFTAMVNFTNFMDGINGISGLHGLCVGGLYASLGVLSDAPVLTLLGALTAIAYGVFLPWNLLPPGMFLGDVGSYLLGALSACLAALALTHGVHPVAAVAPVTIYLTDALSTLTRRAIQGSPILKPHRSHCYQRLTDTGLTHLQVAFLVSAFTLVNGVAGLALLIWAWPAWLGASIMCAAALSYLVPPSLRGAPFPSKPLPLADSVAPPAIPASPSWQPHRYAILGASGFIGRAIRAELDASGAEVLSVPAPRVTMSPDQHDGQAVAELARRLNCTKTLTHSFDGVDVVINAAGLATPDAPASPELYGANALLPAIIAHAVEDAGVGRFLHLSSAAVQGPRGVLDASIDVSPFSPYSRSKALGERAVMAVAQRNSVTPRTVILRATSVQGPGRRTTESLRRVARSPLASVAAPGTQPSVVSSLFGMVDFTVGVARSRGAVPALLLQPWEGLSAFDVLEAAGGRPPTMLPRKLCRLAIGTGRLVSHVLPDVAGVVRRMEVMWFGQVQVNSGDEPTDSARVRAVLASEGT